MNLKSKTFLKGSVSQKPFSVFIFIAYFTIIMFLTKIRHIRPAWRGNEPSIISLAQRVKWNYLNRTAGAGRPVSLFEKKYRGQYINE